MGKKQHRRASNSHKARTGQTKGSSRGSICDYCGKRSYASRKYAKEAARIQYPTEHLSPYRCVSAPEHVDTNMLWHLGHLVDRVVQGRATRAQVYGSPQLSEARPQRRGPVPEALRATMASAQPGRNDNDDSSEGASMPTVAETANVSLRGFDRAKGRYREVSAASPLKDRVALTHAALRAHALTHNFEDMVHDRKKGFVGRVSLRGLVRELFAEDGLDGSKLDQLTTSISNAGASAGLVKCIDASQGHIPIWWVAADYASVVGHPPLQDKPAAKKTAAPAAAEKSLTPSERAKKGAETKRQKHGFSGRKPGSRNRARIELLSLTERTLQSLGRAVTLEELYQSADFPVQKGSIRDVVDELVKERRVRQRTITQEDRDSLRAAGARLSLPNTARIIAHSSVAEGGEVPTATWGLSVAPQEAETKPLEPPAPPAEEAPTEVAEEPQDAAEDLLEAGMAAAREAGIDLEKIARRRKAPEPDRGLERELAEARAEIARLQAENAKLKKARDGLLAVLDTMKED